jgi:hypothetical protein
MVALVALVISKVCLELLPAPGGKESIVSFPSPVFARAQ